MKNFSEKEFKASNFKREKVEYSSEYFQESICGDIVVPEEDFHIIEGSNSIIEDKLNNQFVWIPVNRLSTNGTLDGGKSFYKRFGKRNFKVPYQSELLFDFQDPVFLTLQQEISIEKYGGFFVSRYMISENNRRIASIKNGEIIKNITIKEACKKASEMSMLWKENISAHVILGVEYDSMCQYIIDSKVKTFDEVVKDSKNWGHYTDRNGRPEYTSYCELTGSNYKYEVLNIDGIAGNLYTWTLEMCRVKSLINNKYWNVCRGGSFRDVGREAPAAIRKGCPPYWKDNDIGFRVALYIA